MDKPQTIIFTDGSSRGNPGPGGWGAIIVQDGKVAELGGREEHTTNNRMELKAAIEALSFITYQLTNLRTYQLTLYTDSRYLINGITIWLAGWEKNNWMTKAKEEVMNRDLWEKLGALVRGKEIRWEYIGGHSGIPGNERCDEIATSFADSIEPKLFKGSLEAYSVKGILNVEAGDASSSKKSRTKGQKAYSYVSAIDGKVETHATWAECEQRVKGVKGARFKKSLNAEDEKKIKEEFSIF